MKIGILTLQYGANYGGTLQCYALYKTLFDLGYDVEVINFIPTIEAPIYKRLIYNFSQARSIKDVFAKIKRIARPKSQKLINDDLIQVFDQFRILNLKLSNIVNEESISLLNNRYDTIIIGSDQVWSSMVRSHLTYFGDWTPKYSGKFISYAACAYTDKYPYVRREKLKSLINSFSAISVRDNLTKSFVRQFYNYDITIVADPTLLFDFCKFASPALIEEPYILTYVLGDEILGGNINAIRILKEKLNVSRVVAVTTYGIDIPYADITMKKSSPEEWVNLISNASCVFTDSFHGVVFSLKFKRKFIAYYRNFLRASRLIDLREKYNIKKNIITQTDQLEYLNESDLEIPDSINRNIYSEIHKSRKFLIDNL